MQNVVVVVTSLLAWLIPDIPTLLKEQIRRETYITNEIVLRTELQRAQGIDIDHNAPARAEAGGGDTGSYDSERYSPRLSEDIEMDVRHRSKGGEVEKSYI